MSGRAPSFTPRVSKVSFLTHKPHLGAPTLEGPDGRAHLWKVYPEAGDDGLERLRLSWGSPAEGRLAPPGTVVQSVVVAVLRGAR